MRNIVETVLVGDIGGTNARFGIAHHHVDGHIAIDSYVKQRNDGFGSLQEAIKAYLSNIENTPHSISLAVAGPIHLGKVKLTNRDWQISEAELTAMPEFETAKLFNDFAAMARSVPEMNSQDFEIIHEGLADPEAPILVAGPGTGFGVGYIIPIGNGWRVLNTEGGHMAYAPRNKVESETLSILQDHHGYVSLELVASGSGLEKVHKAVCERRCEFFEALSPEEIFKRAKAGCVICQEVGNIRAAATMGAIGDLALVGGSRGGIVLAGGVSEHTIDLFKKPQIMDRLFDRGPRSQYLKEIPISLLTNPMAPLIGAAALYVDNNNK